MIWTLHSTESSGRFFCSHLTASGLLGPDSSCKSTPKRKSQHQQEAAGAAGAAGAVLRSQTPLHLVGLSPPELDFGSVGCCKPTDHALAHTELPSFKGWFQLRVNTVAWSQTSRHKACSEASINALIHNIWASLMKSPFNTVRLAHQLAKIILYTEGQLL